MKIISSYGVELRKQNIPIRQTLEIYRSAVRYLVKVYESVWEELDQIENSKKRFNAAEHLVHTTKRNPVRFDFDFCFPHFLPPHNSFFSSGCKRNIWCARFPFMILIMSEI